MPTGKASKTVKAAAKPAAKPASAPPADDDAPVVALNLPAGELSPAMSAYLKKCQDKLGFVPNVLVAYAFDNAKLEPFVAMYNDLMLGESGLSKLEREMIAVAVSSQNRCYYCLTAHGAAVRQYSGNPLLGRADGDELPRRAPEQAPARHARFRGQADRCSRPKSRKPTASGCARAGFSDRDIWDIAAVAGFFNMSNRVAAATDMRPNVVYHGQTRASLPLSPLAGSGCERVGAKRDAAVSRSTGSELR